MSGIMRLVLNTQSFTQSATSTARVYGLGIHVHPAPLRPLALHSALSRCALSARTGIPLCLLIVWSVGHKGLLVVFLQTSSEISLHCTRDVGHVELVLLNVDTQSVVAFHHLRL